MVRQLQRDAAGQPPRRGRKHAAAAGVACFLLQLLGAARHVSQRMSGFAACVRACVCGGRAWYDVAAASPSPHGASAVQQAREASARASSASRRRGRRACAAAARQRMRAPRVRAGIAPAARRLHASAAHGGRSGSACRQRRRAQGCFSRNAALCSERRTSRALPSKQTASCFAAARPTAAQLRGAAHTRRRLHREREERCFLPSFT